MDADQGARGRLKVTGSAQSGATPEALFALLEDESTWPRWSSFSAARVDRAAPQGGSGCGAVRAMRTPIGEIFEEVVELRRPNLFAYRLLPPTPVRDHRGEVRLEALAGGGSRIAWSAEFGPEGRLRGFVLRLVVGAVVTRMARDLAKAADGA